MITMMCWIGVVVRTCPTASNCCAVAGRTGPATTETIVVAATAARSGRRARAQDFFANFVLQVLTAGLLVALRQSSSGQTVSRPDGTICALLHDSGQRRCG